MHIILGKHKSKKSVSLIENFVSTLNSALLISSEYDNEFLYDTIDKQGFEVCGDEKQFFHLESVGRLNSVMTQYIDLMYKSFFIEVGGQLTKEVIENLIEVEGYYDVDITFCIQLNEDGSSDTEKAINNLHKSIKSKVTIKRV